MGRWIKRLLTLAILLGLLGGTAAWYFKRGSDKSVTYRMAEIKRGDLLATIGATGTLQPEEAIDVGAQVAGQIVKFGEDKNGKPVDFNSEVEKGQVLANIDDATYAADVAGANAQLAQADAQLQRANADLVQFKAKLYQAERDWERAKKLGPSDALSQTEYDAYESAWRVAQANVGIGDAAIAQAKAATDSANATLKKAERNLTFTTIKSPANGVIIARRVNIGQTVVASLNAPSLFLLATDLRRMQIWASVNEADIGSIKPGQAVTFNVDAFAGRTFRGTVEKVRLDATMTQNVVTYTVEILAENPDLTLRPYLTTNVQFEVARKENVLVVPNAALRWMPTSLEQVAPDSRDVMSEVGGRGVRPGGGSAGAAARGGGGERADASERAGQPTTGPTTREGRARRGEGNPPDGGAGGGSGGGEYKRGLLWVQDGAYVKPIRVRAGMTDGTNTEVVSDQIKEGMQVITAEIRADQVAAGEDAKNPFMPQMGRGRGMGGGGGGGRGGGGR
jgi:HlyD family secretion protein